jgi:hypothetical protein
MIKAPVSPIFLTAIPVPFWFERQKSKGGKKMPSNFKSLINVSVWFLFLKGLMAVVLTIYTVIVALLRSEAIPMTAVASCAVGSFAFILSCLAVWIRQKVE